MMSSDGELFVPSDEEIQIPTFEQLVERFKGFLRDTFDDRDAPALEFVEAMRSFEQTLLTFAEIEAVEESQKDFLNAYNEVVMGDE